MVLGHEEREQAEDKEQDKVRNPQAQRAQVHPCDRCAERKLSGRHRDFIVEGQVLFLRKIRYLEAFRRLEEVLQHHGHRTAQRLLTAALVALPDTQEYLEPSVGAILMCLCYPQPAGEPIPAGVRGQPPSAVCSSKSRC